MSAPATVLVLVKEPVPGRVKTRLAADVGDAAAVRLYRAFGQDVLAAVRAAGLPPRICFDPPEAENAIRAWLGEVEAFPQCPGDLGARMAAAFGRAFARGAAKALLVGSDLPDLPPEILTAASQLLDDHDAVLGSNPDGGYHLIGFTLHGFAPHVFEDVPWSTPGVLAATRDALRVAGVSWAETPPWCDVDDVRDLRALAARLAHAPGRAAHTVRVLRDLEAEGQVFSRTANLGS